MLRIAVRLMSVCFLAASVSVAEAPPTQNKPELRPHYLSANSIDVVDLLPDPPAADSPEHQAELDLLLRLQHDRTGAEVARATAEERLRVFGFADVLGPNFTAEKCPKTEAFFKTMLQPDVAYFNKEAKNHWNRPRPATDPRIHSLFKEDDGSYPSGHSIRATVDAEMLAEVLPQYRKALIARGQQIGWDREIAGVHFATDIYAGRVLGHALVKALLANPDVRKQLEDLKPELQQILPAKNP